MRWTRREVLGASALLVGCSGARELDAGRAGGALDAGGGADAGGAFDAGGRADAGGGADAGVTSDAEPTADARPPDAVREDDAPFVGEGMPPLETPTGAGLDGRLYTDLAKLTGETLVTANAAFYIRTLYPDLLDPNLAWTVRVEGEVAAPAAVTLAELLAAARPMGVHLMECSGNGAFARFGMLSAAAWSGVPVSEVLARVQPAGAASRILIEGFDEHSQPSTRSTPGASWIFTRDQLAEAFLATAMNGAPLPRDHGAPVRLLVPGWYGCTCIKWVNAIRLVSDAAPATSQMREFAGRTHQSGVPALARDYLPASMDLAAMPVRVERWRAGGRIAHVVAGVAWGGGLAGADRLEIQLGAGAPYERVRAPPATSPATWTLWSHAWPGARPGDHPIRLRVADPSVRTRRLDTGFYTRTVRIAEG